MFGCVVDMVLTRVVGHLFGFAGIVGTHFA
jgi:hypothetical protein